ncbi:hypothetical protein PFISCL1PPCAC_4504, partial [Pristionchus fissidentatus]
VAPLASPSHLFFSHYCSPSSHWHCSFSLTVSMVSAFATAKKPRKHIVDLSQQEDFPQEKSDSKCKSAFTIIFISIFLLFSIVFIAWIFVSFFPHLTESLVIYAITIFVNNSDMSLGAVLNTSRSNKFHTIQGSINFRHGEDETVDSYTIAVYNTSDDLIGGGTYTPLDSDVFTIHLRSRYLKNPMETLIKVRTDVILHSGEPVLEGCAWPGRENWEKKPYISLRFDLSVLVRTGKKNIFGYEKFRTINYSEIKKVRCKSTPNY